MLGSSLASAWLSGVDVVASFSSAIADGVPNLAPSRSTSSPAVWFRPVLLEGGEDGQDRAGGGQFQNDDTTPLDVSGHFLCQSFGHFGCCFFFVNKNNSTIHIFGFDSNKKCFKNEIIFNYFLTLYYNFKIEGRSISFNCLIQLDF